jgi:hypothetical protein
MRIQVALALAALTVSILATVDSARAQEKLGDKFVPQDVDWTRPVYETTFESPETLSQWKLEGGSKMRVSDGCLVLESDPTQQGPDGKCIDHLVCWLAKELPADGLIEFTVRPANRKEGLNIVFFSARGLKGESIFNPSLAARDGTYRQYHSGELNCYHISYWAAGRGTANLRKSKGFHLVAEGQDLVYEAPREAFQTVRVYRRGGQIRLTVDDFLSLAWNDDGKGHGPVIAQPGWFGLRQMGHTLSCEYGHVKVFAVKP